MPRRGATSPGPVGILASTLAIVGLLALVVYKAEVPQALLERKPVAHMQQLKERAEQDFLRREKRTVQLQWMSPYQKRMARSSESGVVRPLAKKAATWSKLMNHFFHPAAGIKLTDANRLKLSRALQKARNVKRPAWMQKKAEKWQRLEDSTFHHSSQPVSGRERLGYFSEGQGKALRGTAAKWQAYMDANFGHSQDAVAAARIGTAEQTPKAGSRGRDGRDPWGESRHKRRSLIDTLAGNSWVSEAETDPVPSKKPVRFPDSLN